MSLSIKVPFGLNGVETILYSYLITRKNPERPDYIYTSPQFLALSCGYSDVRSRARFADALESMFQKGFVYYEKLKGSNALKIYLSSIWIADKFVYVPYKYILKIVESGLNRRESLVEFYVNLLGTRDTKTKLGHYSQTLLSQKFGISVSTIRNYIFQLEEIKVLVVRHNSSNNGESNTYGLPEDLVVDNRSKEKEDNRNFRRSVLMRYKRFRADPTTLKLEEMHQLFDDVKRYNAGLERKEDELDIMKVFNEIKTLEVLRACHE